MLVELLKREIVLNKVNSEGGTECVGEECLQISHACMISCGKHLHKSKFGTSFNKLSRFTPYSTVSWQNLQCLTCHSGVDAGVSFSAEVGHTVTVVIKVVVGNMCRQEHANVYYMFSCHNGH